MSINWEVNVPKPAMYFFTVPFLQKFGQKMKVKSLSVKLSDYQLYNDNELSSRNTT